MAFDFATKKDDVRAIDKNSKNKWRWDWLEDEYMQQYLRKMKVPGQAYCILCNQTLKYQSSGKKDLKTHMKHPKHVLKMNAVKSSYSLAGMCMGSNNGDTFSAPEKVRPVVPVNDSRLNSEAMILGFLAEHDLQYSLTPHLVKLTQTLAKDPKPLNEIRMDRCSASYKMTYGVGEHFLHNLANEVRETEFCLNIDESTNAKHEKIVAVLVSYFSKVRNEIVVCHLESFQVTRADAKSIYDKIEDMFERLDLPWNRLISVLLDSCNTMRGKKSGLETRLRERAPQLLDIDGDSVHHVHNAAKYFTSPFKYHLEGMFNDIHSDFHWSTDLRSELENICQLIGVKFTIPERFTSHRFLSAYSLAVDTARLLDAYNVFYFNFLTDDERQCMSTLIDRLSERRKVSVESKAELEIIGSRLRNKKMTKDGQLRKERIINKLFDDRKKTKMLLGLYMSALDSLKEYVVIFQSKEPMVHVLHDHQVRLLQTFLSFFVNPKYIPKTATQLKALELSESILLPNTSMFMGAVVLKIVQNSKKNDRVVNEVLDLLRTAYVKCGTALLRKMPITNSLLRYVSALDPRARGHAITISHLRDLPHQVRILTEEEEEQYAREIHRYQLDPMLPDFEQGTRIDHWWASVTDYPAMRKLTLAVLCCFRGPMVEGVFNIMGDIMDSKSSSLLTASVNAIQNVKSALKANKMTSVEYFKREDPLYTPVVPGLVQQMIHSSAVRTRNLATRRQEKNNNNNMFNIPDKNPVGKMKAKELVSENVKRACYEHQDLVANLNKN